MQAFEVSGQWTIPGSSLSIGGILSFSPVNGIRLDLIGSMPIELHPDGYFTNFTNQSYPAILGVTSDGRQATLFDCNVINTKITSGGYSTQELRANLIVLGRHFNDLNELRTNRARAEYTYLQDWYRRSGFNWTWPSSQENADNTIMLTYNYPAEVTALVSNASIKIIPSINASISRFSPKLFQSVYTQIITVEPISFFDWINRFFVPLQHFLTLATNRPNSISDIKLIITASEPITGNENEVQLNVFFDPVLHKDKDKEELNPQDMLFVLDDLQDFDNALNRWFDLSTKLRPALNLFFGAQYRDFEYMDARFIHTIQTIEIYHRHIIGSAGIHSRGSQMNLRSALDVLYDVSSDIMSPLVQNKTRFINKVLASRNYYTHYADELRSKAAQGGELFWLNEALLLMIRRNILHELGFSSEQCIALFQRNKSYTSAHSLGTFS